MDKNYGGGIHALMSRFEPSLRTDSVYAFWKALLILVRPFKSFMTTLLRIGGKLLQVLGHVSCQSQSRSPRWWRRSNKANVSFHERINI
jgi:hypothetical protein